tara:strand:- start:202 stop:414 length:213 start_codon:yes stop_codon:yes gene_type:complete
MDYHFDEEEGDLILINTKDKFLVNQMYDAIAPNVSDFENWNDDKENIKEGLNKIPKGKYFVLKFVNCVDI